MILFPREISIRTTLRGFTGLMLLGFAYEDASAKEGFASNARVLQLEKFSIPWRLLEAHSYLRQSGVLYE